MYMLTAFFISFLLILVDNSLVDDNVGNQSHYNQNGRTAQDGIVVNIAHTRHGPLSDGGLLREPDRRAGHFMLKEIHEQPKAVRDTLNPRIKDKQILLDELKLTDEEICGLKRIQMVACGSAYHVCSHLYVGPEFVPHGAALRTGGGDRGV